MPAFYKVDGFTRLGNAYTGKAHEGDVSRSSPRRKSRTSSPSDDAERRVNRSPTEE
jgi:hypothetical protein